MSANFSLCGQRAVVTGASRGIGAAIADALVDAGAAVALLGREAGTLNVVRDRLAARGTVVTQVADVTDTVQAQTAIAGAAEQLGGLDILINNAGIEQLCDSLTVTEATWDRILDTNLKGAFFCAQAAARQMTRQGGSIINLCSLTSEVAVPGATAYSSSKSGLAGMTRALAAEWAPRGIRVNGIGPGYFRTALTEPFYRDPAWERAVLNKIPQGRFGRLEDLGGAAVFLCSPAAAYITGQVLYIDGGYLAAF
ncbi:MAG TPA: glucose 1-dehydrogenase [Steroidobacteraceae bacterium]|nr:glucose 1-dehydrogenase [Steroidobacteraceae bacterium]